MGFETAFGDVPLCISFTFYNSPILTLQWEPCSLKIYTALTVICPSIEENKLYSSSIIHLQSCYMLKAGLLSIFTHLVINIDL